MTTLRKWINKKYLEDGALRAQDIPYDATTNLRDAIRTLASVGATGPTGAPGAYSDTTAPPIMSFSLYGADSTVQSGIPSGVFCITDNIAGYTLQEATAGFVVNAPGTIDIALKRVRDGTTVDVLSSPLAMNDSTYHFSTTSFSTTDATTGDLFYPRADATYSGSRPEGLSLTVLFG